MKLLITGFEAAFGDKNASQILIQSLQGDPLIADYADRLAFAVLPLNRAEVAGTLQRIFTETAADLALLLGQAPRRDQLNLERFALNLDDFPVADNGGHQPRGETIAIEGPAAYRSTLPRQQMLIERWRAAGIPAAFSNHAGNYLCNHALYQVLHFESSGQTSVRSAFLHIPILPEQVPDHAPMASMSLETLRRALVIAIATLCDEN